MAVLVRRNLRKGVSNIMDYNSMSRAELESALKRLQSNFDDLEETINFNFAYSSAHIGGEQVRRDEELLRVLKEELIKVRELLAKTDSNS
jgi:hypothetical protein